MSEKYCDVVHCGRWALELWCDQHGDKGCSSQHVRGGKISASIRVNKHVGGGCEGVAVIPGMQCIIVANSALVPTV